jgi:tetratricopeptide (TPR) repeat protein
MLTKENGFSLPFSWKCENVGQYVFTFISLLIILLVVYSNTFDGNWQYDDFHNIVQNTNIHFNTISFDSIKAAIFSQRPLPNISFGLNYYFNRLDVVGYHIVNLLIHYLSSIFLFLFVYNTLKLPLLQERYKNIEYSVALLATFFWALHPIQVTSVTYIVQRMASMSGMFYILSMYAYLKARTSNNAPISILFFIGSLSAGLCAIFSKENAVMLPVSIILFDLLLIHGASKNNLKKFFKIFSLPLVLIFITGLIYLFCFSNILESYTVRDFTMTERLLTEPRVVLFYLSLLLYPINSRLTFLHDIDISHSLLIPWTTVPSILLLLVIVGIALSQAKKRPLASFCVLFFFLNHLIEGSILPLELIYEHRNYIPSMLLFVPLAEFIIFTINYFSYKQIIQFAVAFGVVILIFGLGDVTYRRNFIFSNSLLLWMDNIDKYPQLSRPYSNLGNVYLLQNHKDKALYYYKKALELNNFANTHIKALQEYNLGVYYYYEGQYDLALPYLDRAYASHPSYLMTAVYKANILLLNGEYNAAHALIEPLARMHPESTRLNELLCLILVKEKKFAEAEDHAKKFLKKYLFSTFPFPILAEIARKKGNVSSAISFWKLYQQNFPFDSLTNLALIELASDANDFSLLDAELARLCCLKATQNLTNYINKISNQKNLLVYVPEAGKITKIVKERKLK